MTEIPIIDLSSNDKGKITNDIGEACKKFGFFQVIGHGVPQDIIEASWQTIQQYFDLPLEEKRLNLRSKDNTRGYFDRELTKNKRDLKEIFDFGHIIHPEYPDDHAKNRSEIDGFNQWPNRPKKFEAILKNYLNEMSSLSNIILEYIAQSLGLGKHTITDCFKSDHSSFIRLNHYPVGDVLPHIDSKKGPPPGDLGLNPHSDAGVLTILLQDAIGGLEVYCQNDWVGVPPTPDAFVINIGDLMQVWSNDRYKANLHRVQPSKKASRYSVPFFFNPSYDTIISPLTEELGDPPKYKPFSWGEFRKGRAEGDYDDYGSEIQIKDYLISL